MSDILELTIKCMDASFEVSPEDSMSNSDVLSEVDALIMNFRQKFEIPDNIEIGNADAFENDDMNILEEFNQLEVNIFRVCWDHMKTLMLDCGMGDIAREVLDSELIGIKPSWEKKDEANRR